MKNVVLSLAICSLAVSGLGTSFDANARCKPPAKHHEDDSHQAPARDCITSGPDEPTEQVCEPYVNENGELVLNCGVVDISAP